MDFLIAALIVLILSLILSKICNQRFEYTFPLTMVFIGLLSYILSFFNLRQFVQPIMVLFTFLGIIYVLYDFLKNKGHFRFESHNFFSIFLILFLTLFTVVITRGFVFQTWDEFSHWGMILKILSMTNNFGLIEGSETYFHMTSYPPGLSLIINFFSSFNNQFQESNALRGLLLFTFAQLLILFVNLKKQTLTGFLLSTTILMTLPMIFFPNIYSNIYVDAILGIIFANILLFHFYYKKIDWFYIFYISLQLFILASTKQIGIIFAGIALFAILLSLIQKYLNDKKLLSQAILLGFKNISIPFFVVVFTVVSWNAHLYFNKLNLTPASDFSTTNLINFFLGTAPEYQYLILKNFTYTLTTIRDFGNLSSSFFILILIIVGFFYYLQKTNKQFLSILIGSLGIIIYLIFIFFSYLYFFSEAEALRLASIGRYIGTYLTSLTVLAVGALIYLTSLKKEKNNLFLALILLIILSSFHINHFVSSTFFSATQNQLGADLRQNFSHIYSFKKTMNQQKDRVFIISQNNNGIDYWILRYTFAPIKVSPNLTWSLGEPYNSDDVWTTNKSANEWQKMLSDYTFVYLHEIDQRFIDDFGSIFMNKKTIKDKGLYKIVEIDGYNRLVQYTIN